ncbi:MAG TPA: DedA family protein [Capillimicrobium sp.]|nr:DedA family protein [Capillimicrobium sp.]
MTETLVDAVEGAMASPWVLLAIAALAALDALIPMVPSETLVVTAGAFAASTGEPSLALVIVAAGAGAFAGDHVSYATGRKAGDRIGRRARPGSRRAVGFAWAARTLARRGGPLIVVCRYLPGARTAVTLTAGAVAYPLRSFTPFDAVAALSWAVYTALLGFVGGTAFEEHPIRGVALGLTLAFGIAAALEVARLVRHRRHDAAAEPRAEAPCERPAAFLP